MGRLDGKVALITGAQQGIGRGMAIAFARDGADVGINYLDDRAAAEGVAAEVRKSGARATLVAGDVTSLQQIEEMVQRVVQTLGGLDVLVNNAGVYPRVPFLEMREQELAAMARPLPLGRMAEPDDIASVAVFLASDEARYMTGQTVHVNGGSYMP